MFKKIALHKAEQIVGGNPYISPYVAKCSVQPNSTGCAGFRSGPRGKVQRK
jgi:hypothetical protein